MELEVEAHDAGAAPSEARSWIPAVRAELDGYYALAEKWASEEPEVVMEQISAIGARLTTLRAQATRSTSQRASRFRIDELDPLIASLEFQFKVASRRQAIREFDFKLAGGAPS